MNSRRFILRTLVTRSFCDDLSRGRVGGPAQLQDAGNRQANDDESADKHTDRGQSAFMGEAGFVHSRTEPSVSCSKSGTNRNNCALSRRNWTGAKKRSVKSVRLICSMIHRLRAIAQDFAEFRKAGLTHPMMAEIEKELGVPR